MNWDMIGALGELIGAAAVVLTLVYLSRQVRGASTEAQRNRFGELSAEVSRVAHSWGSDPEISDIVYRGLQDPASLTPYEVFRFNSNLFRMFRALEALLEYSVQGGVHEWGAEGLFRTTQDLMAFPGMRQYWEDRQHWYSDGFRSLVDDMLGDAEPVMLDAYLRNAPASSPGTT